MRAILIMAAMVVVPMSASAKPQRDPPRASCPTALPFALPDDRLSSEWGDMEWELWAASAWDAYCTGRESSLACRCAAAYGGGPY